MSMPFPYQFECQAGLPLKTNSIPFAARNGDDSVRDRVVPINLRILIGEVFRKLHLQPAANTAALRMELDCTWIAWFPQRLRRILETLVSNSMQPRSQTLGESRVSVNFRRLYSGYELRVTDNTKTFESLIGKVPPADSIKRHVSGVQVARMLLEESDGELVIQGDKRHGTMSIAKLPVYCLGDFLEGSFFV